METTAETTAVTVAETVAETIAESIAETTSAVVQYVPTDLTPVIETNTMIIFLLSAILGAILLGVFIDKWKF